MTQGNEARVLGYTQKLANCLKHQKTTDYKHLKFVLKPLLRRTNDDIDNVHSVHWVQVLWPLLQYKYSQHSRLPSLPMTSDPSRSQIRNSISRTLFGHLMDGDWVPTFLVGHYTYFSILVFWEILKWIRFWSQVPGFTGPGRGNMGWWGLSCGVTINFGSEPLIIVSRPTWTFLQSQNFSSAVRAKPVEYF